MTSYTSQENMSISSTTLGFPLGFGASKFNGKEGITVQVRLGSASRSNQIVKYKKKPVTTTLRWNDSVNDEGEEGFICEHNKIGYVCYGKNNTYCDQTSIDDLEEDEIIHFLQIVSCQHIKKSGKKCGKVDCTKHTPAPIPSPVPTKCRHVRTKGKRKGMDCGKDCERGMDYCQKHSLSDTNSISSDSSAATAPVETEHKRSRYEDAEFVEDKDEEAESDDEESETCSYVFTKGKHKDKACGKDVFHDGLCNKHAHAAAKKAAKRIEKSDSSSDEQAQMASSSKLENMVDALLSALPGLLEGSLKDKYIEKAMEALQTEEAKVAISLAIKPHVPAPKSPRKAKKPKDPAAPKAACSSWIWFCKENRRTVMDENGCSSQESTKLLSGIWKTISAKKKAKYTKLAANDKARFLKEKEAYEPSEEWKEKIASYKKTNGKGKSKGKAKGGLKRPRSSYNYFCGDKQVRATVKRDNPDMDSKEVFTELGRIWSEDMTDEDKQEYIDMATADKERYTAAKSQRDSEQEPKSPKAKSSRSDTDSDTKKKGRKRSKKKDKKRSTVTAPISPFIIYAQETRAGLREKHPDWSADQLTKKLQKKWGKLSAEQQAQYK
jgi:hypothetical protein